MPAQPRRGPPAQPRRQRGTRRHRTTRRADPSRRNRHLPRDLRCALSLGGLADLTYRDESVDDVRAALRAYGQWLIQVADKAH
jgi:hypothetical protein